MSIVNQELAAPVKGIANAFRRGISLSQRIYKFAQNSTAIHMLDILRPVQGLEKSLNKSEAKIKDTYGRSVSTFGRWYLDALGNDHVTTNRLHALTINLLEQINSLDEYIFDPASFDLGSIPYIQRESERCCDQAVIALGNLHEELLKEGLQQYNMRQDDRATLPSARRESIPRGRCMSEVSPMTEKPTLGLGIQVHEEASRSNSISSIPQPAVNISVGTQNDSPQNGSQELASLQAEAPTNIHAKGYHDVVVPEPLRLVEPADKAASRVDERQLIKEDEVRKQINVIDEFLAKRMKSRESFRDELNRLSMISTTESPISPDPNFTVSPVLQAAPTFTENPPPKQRSNSVLLATIMETLDGEGPPVPPKDDPWTPSTSMEGEDSGKMLTNEPDEPRKDSETLVIGMPKILPDTPPYGPGPRSPTDQWGTLGPTGNLSARGYGDGVVDDKEVVGQKLISDPGLIPTNENYKDLKDLTPATSVQSVDYSLRHDSSFFKYGGFCDGAKMSLRGVGGTMKELRKPDGMYKDVMVMKCTSCSFEVGYNDFHRDRRLERAGTIKTQGLDDIEYRSRFLIKSHLKTRLSESPIYACLFCVEENKTLEEQDATVFFSVPQFLRHIQKHPRRLKDVEGVKIVYGPQPEGVVDFDLHFLTMEAKVSPTADIKAQIASGGTGYALVNHRPGAKGFKAIDPERRPTLQFAIGARIVGIAYPDCFHGDWCSGYHDSIKALFPASAVQLDPPQKDDVLTNQKSTLVATAKWSHKPKDTIGGWLSFSKKDQITHIAYPYQEFWCWTGKNSKGDWGIFPKDFVGGLVDSGSQIEPPLSPRRFVSSSASGSGSISGRRFIIGNRGNHAAEKEAGQSSHFFTTKRKTSGFARHFTVKSQSSHTSRESSEYAASMTSNEGIEYTL